MSKCGKNKNMALKAQPNTSLMSFPHFHIFCDLVLYRPTATWKLFVLHDKKQNVVKSEVIYASAGQYLISKNQSRFVHNLSYNTMIESHGSYRI